MANNMKAHFVAGGNTKLGKSVLTFSKLYGDELFYIRGLGIFVKGSCGGYCIGCKNSCYVKKSYRYDSVMLCHAVNTLAIRESIAKAFDDLDAQLTRKRNKAEIVRIHQSGELESLAELIAWLDLARKHPETVFYLYSKAYDFIEYVVEHDLIPSNIIILVSIWHEFGIDCYLKTGHNPQIKAFILIDGFDYISFGIEVETMCFAYDRNGKMNHDITCDLCKKCFNKTTKTIGCFEH